MEQLTENPYYQYFIGLSGYKEEPPIDASTLVLFYERLKIDVIMEANEYMLDATCAPSNIRYPQDVSLLNEARENWKRLSFVSAKHMDFSDPHVPQDSKKKLSCTSIKDNTTKDVDSKAVEKIQKKFNIK